MLPIPLHVSPLMSIEFVIVPQTSVTGVSLKVTPAPATAFSFLTPLTISENATSPAAV